MNRLVFNDLKENELTVFDRGVLEKTVEIIIDNEESISNGVDGKSFFIEYDDLPYLIKYLELIKKENEK